MNPETPRFRQEQQQKVDLVQHAETKAEVEFASPEELIRHDAGQNPPPASIAHRLNESIKQEPKPAKPWWKRILS